MPWMIQSENGKYLVYKQGADKKPEGKVLGTHPDEASAKQQLAALYANSPDEKSTDEIPPIEKPANQDEGDGKNLVTVSGSVFTIEEVMDSFKKDMQSNVGGGVDRDKIPDSSFVFPDERTFPVVIAKDVHDAVSSWGQYKGTHSFDDFKTKLSSLAKRKGFESSLPMNWEEKKSLMNLDYVKSVTNGLIIPDMAVKYVSRDIIRHPVFIWGDPKQLDVEREFFNKKTDLWDEPYKDMKRPLTWDHAKDAEYKDENPLIGQTLEYEDDDVARWAISRLERNRRYRKAIDRLIEESAVGSSSDSAPQYVVRQKVINGKSYTKSGASDWLCEEDGTAIKSALPSPTYIKRWPWVASALTDVPCEPRMNGSVEWFKSLGIELPEVQDTVRDEMALKARYFKLFL